MVDREVQEVHEDPEGVRLGTINPLAKKCRDDPEFSKEQKELRDTEDDAEDVECPVARR